MRLLADENIPLDTVHALREAGHDVYSATESSPGSPDIAHIERAATEDRLILTFDRDFGELAVRGSQKPRAGVLLLRRAPRAPQEITRMVLDLIAAQTLSGVTVSALSMTRTYDKGASNFTNPSCACHLTAWR